MRWTSSRVSGATSSRPFMTRETVATETPARSAISRIVTRGRMAGAALTSVIEPGFPDFRNYFRSVPEHFTKGSLTSAVQPWYERAGNVAGNRTGPRKDLIDAIHRSPPPPARDARSPRHGRHSGLLLGGAGRRQLGRLSRGRAQVPHHGGLP